MSKTENLPDFVVFGGSKCGTHWINECLREHPEVHLTQDVHEIFFFDRYFDRGTEWYSHYFRKYSNEKRIGDVTPTYLAHPEAAFRLAKIIPDATLIASLRNPVQRAWSKYLHLWRKGDIQQGLNFREACSVAPEIVGDGMYGRCLKKWQMSFSKEQLHYLILDDARTDPFKFMKCIYAILDVDDRFRAKSTQQPTNTHQSPRSLFAARYAFRLSRLLHKTGLHSVVQLAKSLGGRKLFLKDSADKTKDPPRLSPQDSHWLFEQYHQDVISLSELTGRDLIDLWFENEKLQSTL